MNIFVLHKNPYKCAVMHCDKHVVKMILETAQMLSTTVILAGGQSRYKKSFENHPCTIWVRQTRTNFIWTCMLGIKLCEQYEIRYGKIHKSKDVILDCFNQRNLIRKGSLTPFAMAMPEELKIIGDPVLSYRCYYVTHKLKFCKYTNVDVPNFLKP